MPPEKRTAKCPFCGKTREPTNRQRPSEWREELEGDLEQWPDKPQAQRELLSKSSHGEGEAARKSKLQTWPVPQRGVRRLPARDRTRSCEMCPQLRYPRTRGHQAASLEAPRPVLANHQIKSLLAQAIVHARVPGSAGAMGCPPKAL